MGKKYDSCRFACFSHLFHFISSFISSFFSPSLSLSLFTALSCLSICHSLSCIPIITARSLSLFSSLTLSASLSVFHNSLFLFVNDNDNDHSFSPLSVRTDLTYPECQSGWAFVGWQIARITQKEFVQVILCKPQATWDEVRWEKSFSRVQECCWDTGSVVLCCVVLCCVVSCRVVCWETCLSVLSSGLNGQVFSCWKVRGMSSSCMGSQRTAVAWSAKPGKLQKLPA